VRPRSVSSNSRAWGVRLAIVWRVRSLTVAGGVSCYPAMPDSLGVLPAAKLHDFGNVDVRGAYQITVGNVHFVAVEVGYRFEAEETVHEMAQGALGGEAHAVFSAVSWGMWGTRVFSKICAHNK
jgi:hypothetical protein